MTTSSSPARSNKSGFIVSVACLVAVLCFLFWRSFLPDDVQFSNDGPLGAVSARAIAVPESLKGVWQDLNWIGTNGGSYVPNVTSLLRWLYGPQGAARFDASLALLFVGLSSWFFFRQLKLSRLACLIGSLATLLNSDFLSTACWGVAPQVIAVSMCFLALAALVDDSPNNRWPKVILAGLAVGMGVMEGADVAALFSLLVAAFVLVQTWVDTPGSAPRRLIQGVLRVAVVAACAAFIATQALSGLIGTQIKGVVGTAQDARTRQEHWDWATQWSLPKREALGLIIPGLFGYRIDTPKDVAMFESAFDGGNYWGAIGRDPAWNHYLEDRSQGPPPDPSAHFLRFTGGGAYPGVLVVLVALWAALQSASRNSVFSLAQRKLLWFWAAVVVVALLLAFGRYAPFYQFLYALPYFSTIRNPAKFLHILNFALVILFAYGIHGLSRRYLEPAPSKNPAPGSRSSPWWARIGAFERRWMLGSFLAILASLMGWWFYSASRHSLQRYLATVGFDDTLASAIAGFSIRQVGWFILVLSASVLVVAMILSGTLAGRRAKWAAFLLVLILGVDLTRADIPWIIYWNYKVKYASNPVVDQLRDKPYEHRVAILPFPPPQELSLLDPIYRIEWTQHLFLYNNIQSLDIIQMPREPEDYHAFESALRFLGTPDTMHLLTRRWALTNTRYLLGPAAYLRPLNEQIDPVLHRFRIVTTFKFGPKPGVPDPPTEYSQLTAIPSPDGPYALFEFTGALPRAKLFSSWLTPTDDKSALTALGKVHLDPDNLAMLQQVGTNDFLTLKELAAPEFDPAQFVMLASHLAAPASRPAGTNGGTVEFTSYAPKEIHLHAVASAPSVLMLADKYDPNWQVWVDGKRAELLRCDYIMRGVFLQPGSHSVEFLFKPSNTSMYVSATAIGIGLLLLGFVVFSRSQPVPEPVQPAPASGQKAPASPGRTASR